MSTPIARYLDHAVLKPDLTLAEATEAIELGLKYEVRTVCVRPCDVELANKLCQGTSTDVCVVLAFPHGTHTTASKVAEAQEYVRLGVAEVDMVANYGRICSEDWDYVKSDIAAVAEVLKPAGIPLKVIFETSTLKLEHIKKVTELCIEAGADFVKTSTGFNGAGATEEAVKAMVETAAGRIKVKPSGGIRGYAQAKAYVDMGADRLGVGFTSTPGICDDTETVPAAPGAY
ncbi:deoxyribose-phosphate aldolase [Pelagicoccus albus]|uniref:Deoxyribose-phosphate aldolase n=1 Tax=Pelagicoccus albus TaxID=415222 RepID=A0A7X1B4H1_9BACT|nr:deoxyribose-phosphate aldolase [Pelagicoccus albus]MBC2605455.1 deoxyribose-phosphate aldolase [Pelagicoccus albus]